MPPQRSFAPISALKDGGDSGRRIYGVIYAVAARDFRSSGGAEVTEFWGQGLAWPCSPYPRPTNGIFVAITVINSTLASSGSPAM